MSALTAASLTVGDVSDFDNFMGAVIDDRAFSRHADLLKRAGAGQSAPVHAACARISLG